MKPHKCPVCNGGGKFRVWGEITSAGPFYTPCHACGGSGVLWERSPQEIRIPGELISRKFKCPFEPEGMKTL